MADNRRYYIDGSTVRKLDMYEVEPKRREYHPEYIPSEEPEAQPEPVRKKRTAVRKKKRNKDRRWVDEFKHGIGMTCAAIIVVGLCFYILKLSADVREGKNNIADLKAQLNAQLDENAEYSSGLESMTNLEEIYNIATKELGMVYSEPGQTLYYSQSDEDYVVQYKNVPEAK
ncbi:MAG: hypothetical protein ACI4EF_02230 [Coprococcus sp.]